MPAADHRENESGIEIKPVYTAADETAALELPGEFPYTRGPYPDMYRGRPWTIRQYAGFASAEESNERYRYLLERGQTGLSIAFDLPTQLGYDSDDPRALGEVGRTGVAIDSLADMEILLAGIPLGEVSTSMTINAPASLLLLLYELVAEGQGVPGTALRGTVQNDILKEYIARGNYIFPPRPSMRLTTDLFAYCADRIPSWNTISISGYHIREAGSTAVQELAFTLANGIAYCTAAVDAGLSPDDFGARLSFFFNAHNDFFQEVAKFRAARRLWARIMHDRFGATNPRAVALRFHAQTGGSTLTAQQPENNVVRVAIQALSAICGGAQSLHTNSYDEALALPSQRAATIALRTQQILASEAGTTLTADPLGGSFYIESLTDTPDGQFGAGPTATKGRDALKKMINDLKQRRTEDEAKSKQKRPQMYHMAANHTVEFIDKDHARYLAYWITVTEGAGQDVPARFAAAGREIDELVRVNGQWLIKVRDTQPKGE